jgi:hypothetical protein
MLDVILFVALLLCLLAITFYVAFALDKPSNNGEKD